MYGAHPSGSLSTWQTPIGCIAAMSTDLLCNDVCSSLVHMNHRPGVRTVTDAKALSAMANPFRSRMMDALKVDGPSTASALAARTGQAVGSASHHLKVLHEAGLVEEAPELAKDRRERWWRLVDPGTRWSRADFADDTAAVTAAYAAEALALQRQFERTREWNANAASAPEWDAVVLRHPELAAASPPTSSSRSPTRWSTC